MDKTLNTFAKISVNGVPVSGRVVTLYARGGNMLVSFGELGGGWSAHDLAHSPNKRLMVDGGSNTYCENFDQIKAELRLLGYGPQQGEKADANADLKTFFANVKRLEIRMGEEGHQPTDVELADLAWDLEKVANRVAGR
jgi:hypothetical protein